MCTRAEAIARTLRQGVSQGLADDYRLHCLEPAANTDGFYRAEEQARVAWQYGNSHGGTTAIDRQIKAACFRQLVAYVQSTMR